VQPLSETHCAYDKTNVDKEKLKSFVLMPEVVEISMSVWWAALPGDHVVDVCYPHEKHGLAVRVSNNAKLSTKELFLKFVDNNSQLMEGTWIQEIQHTTSFQSSGPLMKQNATQAVTVKKWSLLWSVSLTTHKEKLV